ncbi:MAG: TIGR00730 family Rossman fold protein [Verrucomicrobiales bacterium]|nr:TIGR00730 family Rossman fold protein [Verrucomicrobiales bacterium]
MKRVCVFCGSNSGANPKHTEVARDLVTALAERGLGLVYGGGNVGLMGTIADAALSRNLEVIGVIPQALTARELAHHGVTKLHAVQTMHERKALMADLADGWIALPGGFGTLDEFCEILTWSQLGLHTKPCGLLNVAGFFQPFLSQIDRAVEDRFIRPEHASMVLVETEPRLLLNRMESYRPPLSLLHKWIDRDAI